MSLQTAQPTVGQSQAELKRHYLPALRLRFKSEVNRLTSGGMVRLLGIRPDGEDLSFLMSYLYIYHWLRQQVATPFRGEVLASFSKGPRGFLIRLLDEAEDAGDFVQGYITHWSTTDVEGPVQRQQLQRLLTGCHNDPQVLTRRVLTLWDELGLLQKTPAKAYSELGHRERDRYREMLGDADHQRLALVDALPDQPEKPDHFAKLGLIPAMGCPQTCRHCMFIWRPPSKDQPDAGPVMELVDSLTDSVLFTGGDLTHHMDHFYRAVREMSHIRTFAILLNGDFAVDKKATNEVLHRMTEALEKRQKKWPRASILLQISFDEFHQEVVVGKDGRLKERIPVSRIANIVEAAPRYSRIQLCLLHKQTHLNFSMDLFKRGVFNRLVEELGRRKHQLQILSTTPAPRQKVNPMSPGQRGQLVKDASFVLSRYPDRPILFTSSTIDAYGRAETLEAGEFVKDQGLLQEVLAGRVPEGEVFDIDMMFWFSGWVTLFSAVHICLGNLHQDGAETILARQRKDPLTQALHHFDLRLLEIYREVRDDLDAIIANSTGPHHLFHVITESADVRLHMTRRLVESTDHPESQ
ncbi:MAG: hypothetical protein JMN25_09035 [gamma proteobacterium endosymbiont of Lamellibrachia anaximandri]|nr:hypothetical protein [gamma proteobacterium endosymbiont of Lamellibrachia anaximandri]